MDFSIRLLVLATVFSLNVYFVNAQVSSIYRGEVDFRAINKKKIEISNFSGLSIHLIIKSNGVEKKYFFPENQYKPISLSRKKLDKNATIRLGYTSENFLKDSIFRATALEKTTINLLKAKGAKFSAKKINEILIDERSSLAEYAVAALLSVGTASYINKYKSTFKALNGFCDKAAYWYKELNRKTRNKHFKMTKIDDVIKYQEHY